MRNLFIGATLALAGLFSVSAVHAQAPVAGEHYNELRTPQPVAVAGKVEVVEVFWYGCPACNMFESSLNPWVKQLPGDVNFVRVPAQFNEVLALHARLYYTLEVLRAEEQVHAAVFAGIHQRKDPRLTPTRNGREVILPDSTQLADFVAEHGVNKDDFLKTFDSFAVNNRLARAERLVRSYQVSGVPEIIVNGKYRLDLQKAGGPDQLLQFTDALIAQERAAQQ
jgi:thiol:disulfide interchange protein DsbA